MTIKSKKNSLLTAVDSVFIVGGEMIEDNGEDSYAYSVNDKFGFVAVFDGCGGIGSRKYEQFENKTGAYIASHACAKAMLLWFERTFSGDNQLSSGCLKYIAESLKDVFESELKKFDSGAASFSAIKGSLAKKFPTTASIIVFCHEKNQMISSYIWAGDSRGFMLDSTGLVQLTCDDIEGEADAMQNLTADNKLTNMVCADGKFKLNSKTIVGSEQGIMITATDGFFSYFPTPMEFEYMLLDTLMTSESIDGWKAILNQYIKTYTADDYTMGVAIYGYKSFKALKNAYIHRYEELYERYILTLPSLDDNQKQYLWNEYKKNYYRGE